MAKLTRDARLRERKGLHAGAQRRAKLREARGEFIGLQGIFVVLDGVVGDQHAERVLVTQRHGRSQRRRAAEIAESAARALLRVSLASSSGTLSATTPAPAVTSKRPSCITTVRMAIARSKLVPRVT